MGKSAPLGGTYSYPMLGERLDEASAGEQVRDIVKGIIEGVVGVEGMYTIGM